MSDSPSQVVTVQGPIVVNESIGKPRILLRDVKVAKEDLPAAGNNILSNDLAKRTAENPDEVKSSGKLSTRTKVECLAISFVITVVIAAALAALVAFAIFATVAFIITIIIIVLICLFGVTPMFIANS
jgi:uncharacterized membrane protein